MNSHPAAGYKFTPNLINVALPLLLLQIIYEGSHPLPPSFQDHTLSTLQVLSPFFILLRFNIKNKRLVKRKQPGSCRLNGVRRRPLRDYADLF